MASGLKASPRPSCTCVFWWTPLGFEVSEAASGEEAIAVAIAWKPALMVMDLAMPGMDGYETTRRILGTPELSKTVIIAMGASGDFGEAALAEGRAEDTTCFRNFAFGASTP